jgi:HEXXH motif-containing protein
MNDAEFIAYSEEKFVEGQRELMSAMRTLVAREDAEIYEALAEAGDAAFLEPLLFTYFFAKPRRMGLAQIAFGHVPAASRPSAFPFETDTSGIAYLPNLGYVSTRSPSMWLTAAWDAADGIVALEDENGRAVPFAFRPRSLLADSTIELFEQSNPLLDATFLDVDGAPLAEPVPSAGLAHGPRVARALALLGEHTPRYADLLRRATRGVFAFRYPRVNSFATLNAHGVVFFTVSERDDEVYYVDELTHQCGHVIFNAISVRRRELFVADPDVPVDARRDTRSLYTVLHGLYTERAMVECLRRLDERSVFRGRQAHELRGRLAFIVRKMQVDVANTRRPDLFTPLGEDLVAVFRATYERAERERADLFHHDLKGQPYNFDYALYAERNPMHQWFDAAE